MKLPYHLLDVFTNRRFGGNQLAVFTEPPPDLSPSVMQAIAKEMNLSEITFVLPPQNSNYDYRLRIFTPAKEMPMAGHPTVGSAFILAKLGKIGTSNGQGSVTFEEGVGPIQVTVEVDNAGIPTQALMRQPLPMFLEIRHDRDDIANMLSLKLDDLHDEAPCRVVSCGVPFLFVVVNSLANMRKINFRLDRWQKLLMGSPAENVFVTCTETQYANATVHSRMFAPALGISEDPATGAASGPLGAYLLKYALVDNGILVSEQGIEMGRPSFIHIWIDRQDDEVSEVVIGGECVYLGHGTLYLD